MEEYLHEIVSLIKEMKPIRIDRKLCLITAVALNTGEQEE